MGRRAQQDTRAWLSHTELHFVSVSVVTDDSAERDFIVFRGTLQ